jgi:hypothetical protein
LAPLARFAFGYVVDVDTGFSLFGAIARPQGKNRCSRLLAQGHAIRFGTPFRNVVEVIGERFGELTTC